MRRASLALAIVIAACGSDAKMAGPGPTLPPAAPVLKSLVVSQAINSAPVGAAIRSEPVPTAYVSLPEGTFPNGQTAAIRNLASGAQVSTAFLSGGWDPVPIAAQAGDTLSLTISTSGEQVEFIALVPIRARPIVVRTSPPPGKRDVPLNASLLVVFSEPMDPVSINSASVLLLKNGLPVIAALTMEAGKPWLAQLVPSQILDRGATYEIVVTQSAKNINGESLEVPLRVEFTTVSVPPPPAPPLYAAIVSQAVLSAPVGSAIGSQLVPTAYVSLPEGIFPEGQTATIRNPATGAQAATAFLNGGWDPVAIAANGGDTLRLTLSISGSSSEFIALVPLRARPVVVRTDPPLDGRGLPLDAAVLVVFSEPMDSVSINSASVQLVRNGAYVSTTVTREPGKPWLAHLIPDDILERDARYELLVNPSATDAVGESLEVLLRVRFTTSSVFPPPTAPSGVIAFVSTRDGAPHIYLANPDGSGLRRLTVGVDAESSPAWSRDGRRLAFNRGQDLYLINADGTGETKLPDIGRWPSWSPDGNKLLVTVGQYGGTLMILDLLTPGASPLVNPAPSAGRARWSPDGEWIVYEGWVDGPDSWRIMIMAPDGSQWRPTEHWGGTGAPAWFQDGSRFAQFTNSGIFIVDPVTLAEKNLGFREKFSNVDGPNYPSGTIDWSPDGGTLLFATPDFPDKSEARQPGTGWHVWMLDLKTHQIRRWTPTSSGEEWDAAFSPRGVVLSP